MALERLDHGLGDGGRRDKVTLQAPQREGADIETAFLDRGETEVMHR